MTPTDQKNMLTSIITAVHNQLGVNRLYWETVTSSTDGDFELIIIDNASTDGSREFYRNLAANDSRVKLIENDDNYSYPYCNNQGIDAANGDLLAFLNNDILLPPHWDTDIRRCIGRNGFHVLTLSSSERVGDKKTSTRYRHRWNNVKNPLRVILGQSKTALKIMTYVCYGNFNSFCACIKKRYGYNITFGFSGSAVCMDRRGLELAGRWDESQQAADFDLMCRTIERNRTHGDLMPCAVVDGVFVHHFCRMTLKKTYKPFADANKLISIDEKWKDRPEILERCREICRFENIPASTPIDSIEHFQLNTKH